MISGEPISGAPISGEEWPEVNVGYISLFRKVGGVSAVTGYTITAQAGSYSYSGQSATILRSSLISAQAGAYSYTGQDSVITYTPVSGAYTITAQAGAYTYSGVSADLTFSGESIGASRAGRPRRRRRYLVEIDGEEFEVDNISQAEQLLEKAKSLAEKVVAQAQNSIIIKPGLRVPQIRTPNRELVPVVQKARSEIRDLYTELKRDLEIRMLMARAEEEDEEETILRLLM